MILEIATFKHPDIVHGFSLRDVSLGFLKWTYVNFRVLDLIQTHSDTVVEAGKSARGDALITSQPGMLLVVKTADCLPVLFHCPEPRVVAAAHAGWRGLSKGILKKVVQEMKNRGCSPERIRAAIGPAIGPCCYEVGPEVFEAFRQRGLSYVSQDRHLDLFTTAVEHLKEEGLLRDNIHLLPLCTYCNELFFPSFRRERVLSSQILSFIGIKPPASAARKTIDKKLQKE